MILSFSSLKISHLCSQHERYKTWEKRNNFHKYEIENKNSVYANNKLIENASAAHHGFIPCENTVPAVSFCFHPTTNCQKRFPSVIQVEQKWKLYKIQIKLLVSTKVNFLFLFFLFSVKWIGFVITCWFRINCLLRDVFDV